MNKNLKLVPIKETDAEFLFEMMQDKEYQKHYLERLIPKSLNEVKKLVKSTENKFEYYFIVYFKDEKIGVLDIYKIMKKDGRASIGYGIKRELWGKGYGTKLCKIGVEFAKKELKLHTLEATAEPNNEGSKRVLEKNGFKQIGVMKDYYLDRGKFVDRALYWKVL